MKHALKAVIALVMGAGLAASAQAHGTYTHRSAAMNKRPAQMSQRQAQMKLSPQRVKTAQQELKADGLYKGKVDGKFGPKTRRAVASFQQRNGLKRTAKLNQQTLNRLTGNQAVGVGSSRPTSSRMMLNNANGSGSSTNNANGSGSSTNNATTPMVPPATNAGNAGASNNTTGTINQNPTANK